jgi:hypothetical protein
VDITAHLNQYLGRNGQCSAWMMWLCGVKIIRKFQGDHENPFYCIHLPEWWRVIDWNVEMQNTVQVPHYTGF